VKKKTATEEVNEKQVKKLGKPMSMTFFVYIIWCAFASKK
jgi:hypothetical protein